MSKKRKLSDGAVKHGPQKTSKSYSSNDADAAGIYNDLSNESQPVRLEAAKILIVKVSESNDAPAWDINTVIPRLVRGLCSPRKAARHGFFVALTEVLRLKSNDAALVNDSVDLVRRLTQIQSGISNAEKKDVFIGRISALSAIIHSQILFTDTRHDERLVSMLFNELVDVCYQNPALMEEAGLVCVQTVKVVQDKPYAPAICRVLLDSLESRNLLKTPEGVALWLEVANRVPATKLPKDVWRHRNPLSKHELPTISQIMRRASSGPADETLSKKRSGQRQVQPSFAWEILLQSYSKLLVDESDGEGDLSGKHVKLFSQFWSDTVDKSFFADNASSERKFLGLQIATELINKCDSLLLPFAFSPNVVRCTVNHLSSQERYLHNAAKAFLNSMVRRATTDPKSGPPILDCIVLSPIASEKTVGLKTTRSLIHSVKLSFLEDMCLILQRRLQEACNAVEPSVSRISWLADLLAHAFKAPVLLETESEMPIQILCTFAKICFCDVSHAEQQVDAADAAKDVSSAIRNTVSTRLFASLGHAAGIASPPPSFQELPILVVQDMIQGDKSKLRIIPKASDELIGTFGRAVAIVFSNISTTASIASNQARSTKLASLKYIISITLLNAFNEDMEALTLLDELCNLFRDQEKTQSTQDSANAVMDVILSLSARDSVIHRRLAEQAFTAFSRDLSESALDSMFDVLGQPENAEGQKALFDANEDIPAAGDVDGLPESSDDVELDKTSLGSDVDVDDASENSHSGEEDDDAEEGPDLEDAADDDELSRFNAALASALGTSDVLDSADGAGPAATESDSEESMDDEQMLALEPHLTALFKDRAARLGSNKGVKDRKKSDAKREHSAAKENITRFKNRVLDLLSIWLKQDPCDPLRLQAVMPFLTLIRTTSTKQIAEKTASLLRTWFDNAKSKGIAKAQDVTAGETVDIRQTKNWEILEEAHQEALRFPSKLHASACSRASLFLAKLLVATKAQGDSAEKVWEELVGLYGRTQLARRQRKSGLPAAFFRDFVDWDYAMLTIS